MKNARHEQILRLIDEKAIETQTELAEELRKLGFTVTQATVSRDIRQLLLRKVPDESGKIRYSAGSGKETDIAKRYQRVLKDAFVSIESAGNILVIRTVSGTAMAAGAALDSLDWREVLGCIAGDDTIMVVVRSEEDAPVIMKRIRKIASE